MIGKLKCWWSGKHLRAKLVRVDGNVRALECPRCHREVRRKAKAAAT